MSNLKELHITDTNLRLENHIVKGGILPNKIAELSRTVNVVGETVVEVLSMPANSPSKLLLLK